MSIKARGRLFLLVGATLLLVGGMYETLLQQPVSAEIAIRQLDNSEVGAVAMRSYDGLRYLVPIVCVIASIGFGVWLFRKELDFTLKR